MNEDGNPISFACSECTNQIEKTYEWLRENEGLACPACGHSMAAERAAVVRHVETIRSTIATIRRGRRLAGS
jgi:DNA-directed RNA polymerase subunit RPC12/RpoP